MRDLRAFSWHTGGAVRPLGEGEPRPVVFRDLGPAATLLLLDGQLPRLAGPTSPVTYLRTAAYREPFVDHGHFGRLVVLPCAGAAVWHAGIAEVFVTDADARVEPGAMALVPDGASVDPTGGSAPRPAGEAVGVPTPRLASLAALAREAAAMRDTRELREHLGGAVHDDWLAATAGRLRAFGRELAEVEARLAPLRRAFQATRNDRRRRARDRMAALGLTEVDLCAAWHHIAPARRAEVIDRIRGQDLGADLGEDA